MVINCVRQRAIPSCVVKKKETELDQWMTFLLHEVALVQKDVKKVKDLSGQPKVDNSKVAPPDCYSIREKLANHVLSCAIGLPLTTSPPDRENAAAASSNLARPKSGQVKNQSGFRLRQ